MPQERPEPARAYPKTAWEKGTVPYCSEDCAKSGQSPAAFALGSKLRRPYGKLPAAAGPEAAALRGARLVAWQSSV